MDNEKLTLLFTEVHKEFNTSNKINLNAVYHPYRSLRHTISRDRKNINIKISQLLNVAPESILICLAKILFSKLYHINISRDLKIEYNHFANSLVNNVNRNKTNYSPLGKHYDLTDIFSFLNETYFSGSLKIGTIGWSKRKSYNRLGFYDKTRDLIVISRIFDSKKIPESIIHYLVFHEMLHIVYPDKMKNVRRVIHSREFKVAEQKFPKFAEIKKWLKRNLKYL